LIASTLLGFPLLDELYGLKMSLNDGIEIIENKGYFTSGNVKWDEIRAAGVRITEQSWESFLQICERLAIDLGQVQIYLDLEARIMFVYANPANHESENEVYYVQF